MSMFKVQIKPGTPATFDPSPQTALVNDSVYWFNADPNNAHWPAPSTSNPKGFMDYQVPPNTESTQISLNPGAPYTLDYICVLHPNEKGQIKVVSGKKKGAFGPKTKKGAFGGTTK